MWRCISPAIMCSLWKEMNDRLFRGTHSSVKEIAHLVFLRSAKSSLIKKELFHVKLDDFLCIAFGSSKRRKL